MAELRTRRLDQPRDPRSRLTPRVDPDAFGRLSERIARLLGTGRFLAVQSVVIVVWITLNSVLEEPWRWDKYPFILLTLMLSVQAAYAAPLILLAQNRQDDRDRVSLEEDRRRAERTRTETEYLARELAALRLSVGEVVTRDFLRSELSRLGDQLTAAQDRGDAGGTGSDRTAPDGSGVEHVSGG